MAKLPPRATTASGTTASRIKPVAAKEVRRAPSADFIDVRVVVNDKVVTKMWKLKNSPGGIKTLSVARKVMANAKRDAPVSRSGSHGRKPGYLRSKIGLFVGEDATSMYVDVVTRAKDKRGNYYGRIQNQRLHYLSRALGETKD